jgi:hypothetical protein
MRGLVPEQIEEVQRRDVDGRAKPGHDV